MNNISVWKSKINRISFNRLDCDIKCDVLIIGGGITGISTLYYLKNKNLKVVLVDQNKIGYSTTGNSTGKLNYLQNDMLDKIRKNYNNNVASKYLKAQRESINNIVNIIKCKNINCDLKMVDTYLYTDKENEVAKLKNLKNFLNVNNINVKENNLNFIANKYALYVSDTYVFNPIKFIYGLIDKSDLIYENTSINKIKKKKYYYACFTNNNCVIIAKYVVIASHYPYFNIPFIFPIKACLEKSYLSFSKSKINNISLISYSSPFVSLSSYLDGLIYLSNTHFNNSKVNDDKSFNLFLDKLKRINLKPKYLWSNTDILTSDGLPYIGVLKDNLLIGTGYNTWGLTNGFLAGKIISDIILNKYNEYTNIFNPNRFNKTLFKGYFSNALKSIMGYVNGFKEKNNYFCPHMGCKLIYNSIENTWDCPCHGSRFDKGGKCISAPSNKNINL